jgi:hypothetical protein
MELEGTIPEETRNMERLEDFRISQTGITGTIPEGLYDIEDGFFVRMDFFNTKMSGTISSKIGQLSHLEMFRISDSEFTGDLPTEMGLLTALQKVWLHGNNFVGQIPDEVCSLRGTNNQFTELTADCMPSELTQVAEVTCDIGCCTTCYDSEQ